MQGLATQFVANTKGVYTASGHTTADALTATDLTFLMGLLPQYALPNAKFFCSQYFFNICFMRLMAAGGVNKIADLTGEWPGYSYLDVPIVIAQKLPSTSPTGLLAIYYGDLSKAAAFGDRRQVSVKRSDERYFDTDQIGIFGSQRIDLVVHDVGSSTVAGPVVALKMG